MRALKYTGLVALLIGIALAVVFLDGCNSQDNKATDAGSNKSVKTASNTDGSGQVQSSSPTTENPLSITIMTVNTPVSPGGSTPLSLFAKTKPGAICDIEVSYKGGANEAKALVPKKAQDNGLVSWSWTVDPSVALGKYTITVSAKSPDDTGQTVTDEKPIEIKTAEECKK